MFCCYHLGETSFRFEFHREYVNTRPRFTGVEQAVKLTTADKCYGLGLDVVN